MPGERKRELSEKGAFEKAERESPESVCYTGMPAWSGDSGVDGTTEAIQGAIVVASFAEVLIGLIGGMGFLLRYIGPLTIAPTISLVGLPLAPVAASFCAKHWWIAVMTIALVVIFSQYLRGTGLPCMSYSSEKGFRMKTYRVFHLYAVVLAIAIAWGVCALLTVYDVLPADPAAWGHLARTDVKMYQITKASWFRFPYPFQWGLPTVSAAAVCGMLAAVFAAMIEAIGSFYAAAKMADMPPPPVHAINRAGDKLLDANVIGRSDPSGIWCDNTDPTPYGDASHASTSGLS
ncbi:Solute carrier family 23 member 2 [Lamellibrachia satsuma]|nr:Solute carrier family 23 member 2 [Lamellibrachia satsuma]